MRGARRERTDAHVLHRAGEQPLPRARDSSGSLRRRGSTGGGDAPGGAHPADGSRTGGGPAGGTGRAGLAGRGPAAVVPSEARSTTSPAGSASPRRRSAASTARACATREPGRRQDLARRRGRLEPAQDLLLRAGPGEDQGDVAVTRRERDGPLRERQRRGAERRALRRVEGVDHRAHGRHQHAPGPGRDGRVGVEPEGPVGEAGDEGDVARLLVLQRPVDDLLRHRAHLHEHVALPPPRVRAISASERPSVSMSMRPRPSRICPSGWKPAKVWAPTGIPSRK